ncbi:MULTISPECIES: alpha/beta hydrolase [unclassified Mycobacterium]|uniref:alpha/beta fold hydrolase n=1 Tax=unclassified Mycobacterium TaxID=2642494 RepID=UPI000740150E|nr:MULTISPECIES: alpha/beta hydrolase [unclassified Mycobacterium]KUH83071.1 haloperoxidase [Mycobacterium sp. IS-1556]KUH83149.1 haloperoxidase [Mycobacterium sp. GA-0227b]KUH84440.1 haloperoxidase [Mycobacterium sp. GA-1999]
MSGGPRGRSKAPAFAPAQSLPESRAVAVRSKDGIRLHAEVFGPEDGYPIVLAHGITCAIRVWAHQITDLSRDYRVIAFDHRGHGRSAVPARRRAYSLDHLAADLDSVLDATLAPGERAVIAGHSMGGIAITSWAERYAERVTERADAVALINTTTGDLLRNVQLLPVPARLAGVRVLTAGAFLKTFGAMPLPRAAAGPNQRFLSMLAVGRDADPAIAAFVHELFLATAPAGRGGWAHTLVDHLGPRHIGLANLVVPTLVIGSEKDRLLPIASARRIAREAPNLTQFVELSGGHCAILERPDEVNKHLRLLIDSVTSEGRISS